MPQRSKSVVKQRIKFLEQTIANAHDEDAVVPEFAQLNDLIENDSRYSQNGLHKVKDRVTHLESFSKRSYNRLVRNPSNRSVSGVRKKSFRHRDEDISEASCIDYKETPTSDDNDGEEDDSAFLAENSNTKGNQLKRRDSKYSQNKVGRMTSSVSRKPSYLSTSGGRKYDETSQSSRAAGFRMAGSFSRPRRTSRCSAISKNEVKVGILRETHYESRDDSPDGREADNMSRRSGRSRKTARSFRSHKSYKSKNRDRKKSLRSRDRDRDRDRERDDNRSHKSYGTHKSRKSKVSFKSSKSKKKKSKKYQICSDDDTVTQTEDEMSEYNGKKSRSRKHSDKTFKDESADELEVVHSDDSYSAKLTEQMNQAIYKRSSILSRSTKGPIIKKNKDKDKDKEREKDTKSNSNLKKLKNITKSIKSLASMASSRYTTTYYSETENSDQEDDFTQCQSTSGVSETYYEDSEASFSEESQDSVVSRKKDRKVKRKESCRSGKSQTKERKTSRRRKASEKSLDNDSKVNRKVSFNKTNRSSSKKSVQKESSQRRPTVIKRNSTKKSSQKKKHILDDSDDIGSDEDIYVTKVKCKRRLSQMSDKKNEKKSVSASRKGSKSAKNPSSKDDGVEDMSTTDAVSSLKNPALGLQKDKSFRTSRSNYTHNNNPHNHHQNNQSSEEGELVDPDQYEENASEVGYTCTQGFENDRENEEANACGKTLEDVDHLDDYGDEDDEEQIYENEAGDILQSPVNPRPRGGSRSKNGIGNRNSNYANLGKSRLSNDFHEMNLDDIDNDENHDHDNDPNNDYAEPNENNQNTKIDQMNKFLHRSTDSAEPSKINEFDFRYPSKSSHHKSFKLNRIMSRISGKGLGRSNSRGPGLEIDEDGQIKRSNSSVGLFDLCRPCYSRNVFRRSVKDKHKYSNGAHLAHLSMQRNEHILEYHGRYEQTADNGNDSVDELDGIDT